jgi:ribosomal-protein-serine acetyltransferase
MTRVVRALTDAAFTVPAIDVVEIHHDRANLRSAVIPRRLGFTFVGEQPDVVSAPGEAGIDCTWRTTRMTWRP